MDNYLYSPVKSVLGLDNKAEKERLAREEQRMAHYRDT